MAEELLSLSEASRRTRVSLPTLRKYLAAKKFPRAKRSKEGVWAIPFTDLVAAGLVDKVKAKGARERRRSSVEALPEERRELERLRVEVQFLREQVRKLEAREESDRDLIRSLTQRQLEGGKLAGWFRKSS